MIEIIEHSVKGSICRPCLVRSGDFACPYKDGGCPDYRESVDAAARAVVSFARLVQDEAIWRIPGLLRDTISELEGRR